MAAAENLDTNESDNQGGDKDDNQPAALREIIENTYDAAVASETETNPEDQGQSAGAPDDTDGAAADDEAGKAATADADKDTSAAAGDADSGADPENKATEADQAAAADDKTAYPEHWDQSMRDDFDKLEKPMQDFVIGRINDMEADYTRKRQADSDIIKTYEPVQQMMVAFQPLMQATGWSQADLIRRWAAAESQLATNPHQTIKQLAEHYGVDLTDLAYGGQYENDNQGGQTQGGDTNTGQQPASVTQDPGFQQLANTVNTMQANTQRQALDAFADQTNDDGSKAHPYFDEVINDIMLEFQLDRSQGKQPELPDLYERACWRNTSVRQKMLEAQQKAASEDDKAAAEAAAKKANDEARSKAEQASKAGKSVDGDPSGGTAETKTQHKTLRSAVAAAYDEHS